MAGRCADGETMAGIYAANQSRGLRSPCTLRQGHCPCTHQGHCPWTHFAKNLSYRPIVIPHVNRENEKKQNYGHNENNQKRAGEKATSFLLRLFLCFPGCFASGGRHSAAGPVGASGTFNSQSYNLFLPRSFCVFLGGKTTIPQALRASSLFTREALVIRFAETVFKNEWQLRLGQVAGT